MADPEQDPSSPIPIARGSYNFDFENLDELNPFQSKTNIGNSPPSNGNNNSDLPLNSSKDTFDADIDPFKSKNTLSNSPPTKLVNNNDGEKAIKDLNNDDILDMPEVEKPKKSSPSKKSPGKKSKPVPSPVLNLEQQQPEKLIESPPKGKHVLEEDFPVKDSNETDIEIKLNSSDFQSSPPIFDPRASGEGECKMDAHLEAKSPKKTPSPKKGSGIKKPKSAVKSKTPRKVLLEVDDEIQILAPNPPEETSLQSMENKADVANEDPAITVPSSPNKIFEESADVQIFSSPPPFADSPSVPVDASVRLGKAKVEDEDDEDALFHDAQQDVGDMSVGMTASADLRLANQMTGSLDAVHEFGLGEEGELAEDNEGFVPTNDAFNDNANWEMLEKMGAYSTNASTLGRESLYVAFDPNVQPIRQAPEVIPEKEEEITPPRITFQTNSSISSEKDLLQLNTPSPNTVKQKSKNHPAARKLQAQFEGKNVEADQYVDKLLFSNSPPQSAPDNKEDFNMSGNDQVVQLVQIMKYSQTEWNKMKQDLELKHQSDLLNKEKEWSKKLADRDKKLTHLDDKHKKAQQTNEDMRAVVVEFEKTIAQLQAERQKSCVDAKHSLQDIMKERDQALEDLNSVETAFSDLHRRFEKAKGVIEIFKKNEEVLKKCVEEYQGKVKKAESKLQAIKQQAEEKLEQAYNDMERVKKSTTTDIAKLELAVKKTEIQIKGLQQTVEQKKKENEELTSICDELIAKVEG